jgi:hypothetical protein
LTVDGLTGHPGGVEFVPVVGGVLQRHDDVGVGGVGVVVEAADDVDRADAGVAGGVVGIQGCGEDAHGGDGGVGDRVVGAVVGAEDGLAVGGDVDGSARAGGRERLVAEQVEELAGGPAVGLQVGGGAAQQQRRGQSRVGAGRDVYVQTGRGLRRGGWCVGSLHGSHVLSYG